MKRQLDHLEEQLLLLHNESVLLGIFCTFYFKLEGKMVADIKFLGPFKLILQYTLVFYATASFKAQYSANDVRAENVK